MPVNSSQLSQSVVVGSNAFVVAVVAILLLAVTFAVSGRLARREGEDRLRWLIPLALVLHFIGSFAQIFIVDHVYDQVADYNLYLGQGGLLASYLRAGHLTLAGLHPTGDGFVSIVTGVVFTFVGTDKAACFLVFSWLSLLGLIAFYEAFRIAVPGGRRARYAYLLFFMPSLFYWPSAVGKEALMILGLGVAAGGAARLLTYIRGGILRLALGLAWSAAIRPQETLLVFGALAVAFLLRRSRSEAKSMLAPLRTMGVAVLLVAGGVVLVKLTKSFLKLSSLSASGVNQALSSAYQNNTETKAAIKAVSWSSNPLYYPKDVYDVLFDPLPFQAHSTTQLLAAGENLTIILVIVISLARLANLPRTFFRVPYVAMATVYSLVFLYAFAALGNLGLIDRERTLLLPFLFVLLCIPSRRERARELEAQGARGASRAGSPSPPSVAELLSGGAPRAGT